VWSDPYLTGVDRESTARTADGLRVAWDRIFGSRLEIRYAAREIELDDEESGSDPALGLTPTERDLLNREGDRNQLDVSYAFSVGDRKLLVPRLHLVDADLDGDAMANEATRLELSYLASLERLRYVANLSFGSIEYDEVNPIYDEEDEADTLGATFTVFWNNIFGLKGWTGNAGVVFFQRDNDIDFYDTNVTAASFGMLTRF
jgi:hypothetical protein